MRKSLCVAAVTALVVADAGAASAVQRRIGSPPTRLGQCATTTITSLGARLEDNGRPILDSGSAFMLANGVGGVSYQRVRALHRSRVGDRVRTCLVEIPRGCPPGDDRGRYYRTTNLRTRLTWTMADSGHMCGGA